MYLQSDTVMSELLATHTYTIPSTTVMCDSITVRQLLNTFTAVQEHTFHHSIT